MTRSVVLPEDISDIEVAIFKDLDTSVKYTKITYRHNDDGVQRKILLEGVYQYEDLQDNIIILKSLR